MNKATEDKINQIQLIEQSLQNLLNQKQQFSAQLLELESAAKELAQTDEAYKIVGNIMIKRNPHDLESDIKEKMERLTVRMKSIEKQEDKTKERIKDLQEAVMSDMKK